MAVFRKVSIIVEHVRGVRAIEVFNERVLPLGIGVLWSATTFSPVAVSPLGRRKSIYPRLDRRKIVAVCQTVRSAFFRLNEWS